MHTGIKEVVLLDADVIPMQDPESVREMPGYKRTGMTLFFDRVKEEAAYSNSYAARDGSRYLRHWIETSDYATFHLSSDVKPTSHLV